MVPPTSQHTDFRPDSHPSKWNSISWRFMKIGFSRRPCFAKPYWHMDPGTSAALRHSNPDNCKLQPGCYVCLRSASHVCLLLISSWSLLQKGLKGGVGAKFLTKLSGSIVVVPEVMATYRVPATLKDDPRNVISFCLRCWSEVLPQVISELHVAVNASRINLLLADELPIIEKYVGDANQFKILKKTCAEQTLRSV